MKLNDLLNWPKTIITIAACFGLLLAFTGIKWTTTSDRLEKHVEETAEYHKPEMKDMPQIVAEIDTELHVQATELQHLKTDVRGIIGGECIENPYAQLVFLDQVADCIEMGVVLECLRETPSRRLACLERHPPPEAGDST